MYSELATLPHLYFFYVFLLLWLLFVCRLPQPQFGKLVPKTLPLQVVVVKLTKTSFWPPKRIVLTPTKTISKSVEFAEPKCTKWKLTIVKNVPIRKAFVLCVVRKSSKPRITNKVQCRKGENLSQQTSKPHLIRSKRLFKQRRQQQQLKRDRKFSSVKSFITNFWYETVLSTHSVKNWRIYSWK